MTNTIKDQFSVTSHIDGMSFNAHMDGFTGGSLYHHFSKHDAKGEVIGSMIQTDLPEISVSDMFGVAVGACAIYETDESKATYSAWFSAKGQRVSYREQDETMFVHRVGNGKRIMEIEITPRDGVNPTQYLIHQMVYAYTQILAYPDSPTLPSVLLRKWSRRWHVKQALVMEF